MPTPSSASTSGPGPQVSLLIVARNTASFIGAALRSARAQSFTDIEIVVVDDGSTDRTRAIAETHAAKDPRIRIVDGPCRGLAAVRNVSLTTARGRWAAILDSDDLLHPGHIQALVEEARASGAEIVAANMVEFAFVHGRCRSTLFASGKGWKARRNIGLADYIRANSAFGDPVCAGYLKPLLDLAFLRRHGVSYDPRLRIAEDYDLVARMIARGGRFAYLPRPTYFYRRHPASTSHRQSRADLSAMLAAADAVLMPDSPPAVREAAALRKAGIETALRHTQAVDAIKTRQVCTALHGLAGLGRDLRAWQLMAASLRDGVCRRLAALFRQRRVPPPVALVIGSPQPGSWLRTRVDRLAASGTGIVMRARPADDAARARLVDGLPRLIATFVVPPASSDEAGYAMIHPGIDRTEFGSAAQQRPPPLPMAPSYGAATPESLRSDMDWMNAPSQGSRT